MLFKWCTLNHNYFCVNSSLLTKVKVVYKWGTTDIQSCPIKLPPLFRAPAVWVVPVWRYKCFFNNLN